MNIGFIGYGKVNQTLVKNLKTTHTIHISKENRSKKTLNNIEKTKGIKTVENDTDLIKTSHLIISANTPKSALKIGEKFKKYEGIYLDLNNISPKTIKKLEKILKNFIDGAIIGNIKNLELLILSGPKAENIEPIFDFIETKTEKETEYASQIKMLRSLYTKGLSALLIETEDAAKKLKLENQLWNVLELTENKDFKTINKSRIKNTKNNKTRKIEEISELNEFLEDIGLSQTMSKATYNKFKEL